MSNARNLADIITGNFDVPLGALDNVPPSNDASALTTGTLPVGRLPSSGVDASSLTTGTLGTARLPAGSVLQIAKGESTTQVSFGTNQIYYTLYSFNVTAVGDNSRYVFNTYQQAYHTDSAAGPRANLGYSVTIDGTTTRLAGVDGTQGDAWGQLAYPGTVLNRHHVWDSSVPAGTVITVNVLGAMYDAGTIYFSYVSYGFNGLCTVTEVSV